MEEIYFANEDIFDKVSEILSKNGIKEDPIDIFFKKAGEKSLIGIVLNLAKNIAKQKISEKDFTSSLQTELKTSEKISKNILKDIKDKILPLAERVKLGQSGAENKTVPEKAVIASPPRLIDKKENINPIEDIGAPLKNFPKKPDNYREPIE